MVDWVEVFAEETIVPFLAVHLLNVRCAGLATLTALLQVCRTVHNLRGRYLRHVFEIPDVRRVGSAVYEELCLRETKLTVRSFYTIQHVLRNVSLKAAENFVKQIADCFELLDEDESPRIRFSAINDTLELLIKRHGAARKNARGLTGIFRTFMELVKERGPVDLPLLSSVTQPAIENSLRYGSLKLVGDFKRLVYAETEPLHLDICMTRMLNSVLLEPNENLLDWFFREYESKLKGKFSCYFNLSGPKTSRRLVREYRSRGWCEDPEELDIADDWLDLNESEELEEWESFFVMFDTDVYLKGVGALSLDRPPEELGAMARAGVGTGCEMGACKRKAVGLRVQADLLTFCCCRHL